MRRLRCGLLALLLLAGAVLAGTIEPASIPQDWALAPFS
jgi:hypothetical protein